MTRVRFQFTPLSLPRKARAQIGHLRRAVSLLETGIAVSILGIGLIMIAAIFPVALAQHRESADRAQALDMVSRSKAMLHNRLDTNRLWFDQSFLVSGNDSHWHLMPFANLEVGGTWVDLTRYVALVNGRPAASLPIGSFSELQLFGTDVLSDRIAPFNDRRAQEAPNRLIWYGFYRQLANGSKSFTAAVCKQRRNQSYFKQDLTVQFPTLNPTPLISEPQRFPIPWRVTVARFSAAPYANALYIPGLSSMLPRLAPPGSPCDPVSPVALERLRTAVSAVA